MTQTSLAELRAPAAPVEVGFSTSDSYGLMKKIALDFAASDLVPQRYQGKAPNCMIAINMAMRMKADPLMVMQNLYVVYGVPSWSASFLTACFNQCGRFSPISYKFQGKQGADDWGCRAISSYLADGSPIEGTLVTIGIAKAEGWYDKKGSKWQTMPDQMLRYRAAAWMIRSTAPEIGMGFQTSEEVRDTYDLERTQDGTYSVDLGSLKTAATESTAVIDTQQPQTAPQPATETEAPTKNAKTEMDALRSTTREIWESTGHSLEEAEKFTGLYLKQWNRATCTKVEAEARRMLAAKPAPPVQTASSDAFSDASTIQCPKVDALIDDMECAQCRERDGCPSWE